MGIHSGLLALGISYSIKLLSAIATLLFVALFKVGLGPVPFILATQLVGAHAVGARKVGHGCELDCHILGFAVLPNAE